MEEKSINEKMGEINLPGANEIIRDAIQKSRKNGSSSNHPEEQVLNAPIESNEERNVVNIMEKAGSPDKVSLVMGVIGIGNAGNQLAFAASKAGFNTVLINSSKKDLSNEITSSDIPAIIVGDGRGAGKDQRTGFEFLKANLSDVFANPHFTNLVESSDIIVVHASTAGGTGSGMQPLICDRLSAMYPNKIIIPCLVLPKKTESIQSHMNTASLFKQMERSERLRNMSYMAYSLETYANEPDDVAYAKVADKVIEALRVIRGDYMKISPYGMIDERDLQTTLAEPGYMIVVSVDKLSSTTMGNKTIQQRLVDEIRSGPTVPIEKDGRCGLVATISDLPDELLSDPVRTGDLSELYSYLGVARDTFANKSATTSSHGSCHVIISGLSLPYNYLADEASIVQEYVEKNSKRRAYAVDIDSKMLQKDPAVKGKIVGDKSVQGNMDELDDVPDFFS